MFSASSAEYSKHSQSMVGGVVSGVTLIVKVQELLCPNESWAVHVTIVGPTGNVEPLGGEQLMFVMVPQVVDAWGAG